MENVEDKTKCLSKLTLTHQFLQQVKNNINSYKYEPCTSALFETKHYLKGKIDMLSQANQNLLNILKRKDQLSDNEYHLINSHSNLTNDLKIDFLDYTKQFN